MMYELITIDVSSDLPKGLGAKRYNTHPRIGEWIEMDINEKGTMFEVVMVAHSDSGAGSDIYVRKLGLTSQAVKTLCNK
ncbi:hypothetical protein ACS7D5_12930 [Proteus mirabilis]|uniref:hypothetical protein n=2 Tax=Proteus mirabilis TaxID=584 RepID=UPI001F49F0E0|nr:hypothetical protein [Proteus mirabilis]MDM3841424.1 hypothetical protein [Proteus mirabilis]